MPRGGLTGLIVALALLGGPARAEDPMDFIEEVLSLSDLVPLGQGQAVRELGQRMAPFGLIVAAARLPMEGQEDESNWSRTFSLSGTSKPTGSCVRRDLDGVEALRLALEAGQPLGSEYTYRHMFGPLKIAEAERSKSGGVFRLPDNAVAVLHCGFTYPGQGESPSLLALRTAYDGQFAQISNVLDINDFFVLADGPVNARTWTATATVLVLHDLPNPDQREWMTVEVIAFELAGQS